MPGIETWLPFLAGTNADACGMEPAGDRGKDIFPRAEGPEQPFEGVMQATLGLAPSRPSGKNFSPASNSPAALTIAPPGTEATDNTGASAGLDSKKSEGGKKETPPADKPDSPEPSFLAAGINNVPPGLIPAPIIPTGTAACPVATADQTGGAQGGPSAFIMSSAAETNLSETAAIGPTTAGGNTGHLTNLLDTIQPGVLEPAKAAPQPAVEAPKSGLSDLFAKSNAVPPPEMASRPPSILSALEAGPHEQSPVTPEIASPTSKQPDATGTGVAIMGLQMKNQQKTTKVADPNVKVLPVGENDKPRQQILPGSSLSKPVRPAENNPDLSFSFTGGNQHPQAVDTPAVIRIELPSLMEARLRSLDRTHDMVALHSMRLIESKSDVLSVIIKPAVGTELALELRQQPDGVQAHATVTRGDHEFLSQHWGELQQRLEQRGIRLAPLDGNLNFSAEGQSQFQRQQASPEEMTEHASAFAEFSVLNTSGGATARLASLHDGWESWA